MKNSIKTRFSKPQIIAASSTALFLVAIMFLVSLNGSNHSLQSLLKKNRLENEKMLSEKLQLEKEIAQLHEDISLFQAKSAQTDAYIADLKNRLLQKKGSYTQDCRKQSCN